MRTHSLRHLCQQFGKFRVVLIEDDNGRFAVSPCKVAKQLINRFQKFFVPPPDFTFSDKGSSFLIFNPNIRFSTSSKSLACGSTLVMPVQMCYHNIKITNLISVGLPNISPGKYRPTAIRAEIQERSISCVRNTYNNLYTRNINWTSISEGIPVSITAYIYFSLVLFHLFLIF